MSICYDKIDFADYLEKVRIEPDPQDPITPSSVWVDDPCNRGEDFLLSKSTSMKKRRKKLLKRKNRR